MIWVANKEFSGLYKFIVLYLTLGCCRNSLAVEDPVQWRKIAKENLVKYLNMEPNTRIAKNIVLMIGDGMGSSTVTAARILKGQLQGKAGEETLLNFENFPYTAFAKTYSVDFQVPDSAATMTAITSGIKTIGKTLGVDSLVKYNTCHDLTNHSVSSVLDWAQDAGKSTGFVTTSRVTHATPAALYAETTNRDWECDRDLPIDSGPYCTDIAKQLIYNASNIQVILGGGAQAFVPITQPDPTTGKINYRTQRLENVSLIEEWKADKQKRNFSHSVVHNRQQLEAVDPKGTDYLLGLFHRSHMSYDVDRNTGILGEPSLADMTRKALQILTKNKHGFFLMVEGARIDHAHHKVSASRALTETLAFEKAVQTVIDMTNESDTLIIVTADHSHTMTISGYPSRGNGILDLVKIDGEPTGDFDHLPYTTLMYANGPYNMHPRRNLTEVDTNHKNFRQNTVVKLQSETHSGEDVPVYAQGPMAHLLTGVKEQNTIAYIMAHAACIGNIGVSCESGRPLDNVRTKRMYTKECGDETLGQLNTNAPTNSKQTFNVSINFIFLCLLHLYLIFGLV